MADLVLVGRSSSHYTRTARIFALELGVAHAFRPVLDITSVDTANYADNPALKVPILVDDRGPVFGTENICRELVRRSGRSSNIVMRGDSSDRLVMNAEELTLHVMASEVSLIMAKMAGDARLLPPKVTRSIENCLSRLEEDIDLVLEVLPKDRILSFLEVTLFCVLEHLPFRQIMELVRWPRLRAFAERFADRASAQSTTFHFDAA
jgi:glutathione S-transferase